MIAALGSLLNRWSRRWVPDPFVLALCLTLGIALLGMWRAQAAPEGAAWAVARGWLDGVTNAGLLAFALKMCLILVSGHALAMSPPVQRAIARVARMPASAQSATLLVAVASCLASVVHWGLGAIAGALLAREVGRHAAARGLGLHYPLLGAAAYGGFAVWHGGLTGSAPTLVAGKDHFAARLVGTVPLSETLLSPLNLVVTGSLLVFIPLLCRALVPTDPAEYVPAEDVPPLPERRPAEVDSVVHWLQESSIVGALIGALGTLLVVASTVTGRLGVDLDFVVLLFVFLSIALQGSLRYFAEAVADGARGAGAIIIQFPFYFGILGIMKATGMVAWMSGGLVAVASPETLPVFSFWSAGLVNLFIPSGGGQWVVQGEILLEAGKSLGVAPGPVVMAFAYGDAWTNMLQPFWALPLLGIMGLRARDIIGYTAMVCLLMGVVVSALLYLLA